MSRALVKGSGLGFVVKITAKFVYRVTTIHLAQIYHLHRDQQSPRHQQDPQPIHPSLPVLCRVDCCHKVLEGHRIPPPRALCLALHGRGVCDGRCT
jgi:hypothetical protein